ncbi:MAG: hypothetical protein J6Q79_09655 [Clostridia bacterium]|nr:hypothetical protein [Clostridia bacterium]
MKKDVKKAIKTAKIAIKAVKIISTCVVIASAIYAMVPKYDTIEGINTDKLIDTHSNKA